MQSRAAHLRCLVVGGGDVWDVRDVGAVGAAAGAAMAIAICAPAGAL